ncbi:hypothetical protein ACHAXT_010232 [Thalassiosira profunda]
MYLSIDRSKAAEVACVVFIALYMALAFADDGFEVAALFGVSFMTLTFFYIMNLVLAVAVNSYDESIEERKSSRRKMTHKLLSEAFTLLDHQNNNFVSRESIMHVMTIINQDVAEIRGISEDEKAILFAFLDKDGDNAICREEFMQFGQVLLLKLSRKSDYATQMETRFPSVYRSSAWQTTCTIVKSKRMDHIIEAILIMNACVIGLQDYPMLSGQDVSQDPNGYSDHTLVEFVVMVRVLRLGRLLFAVERFRMFGSISLEIIPAATSVFMVLLFISYFFGLLGMLLFGGDITRDPNNPKAALLLEAEDFVAQDAGSDNEQIDSALEAVREALAGFGVLSGSCDPEKVWQRPIPASLFQPPTYLPSLTTLVPRSRLPPGAKIRTANNVASTNGEEELVEVWAYSLTSDYDEEAGNTNDLHHRPLQGNLSSKLTEYTRGTMGVRRPFRPGGMDDDDNVDEADDLSALQSEYLSEEATANARRALTVGSKKAYEEGILITAPPGVSFSEGLRYEDVFDDADQLQMKKEEGAAVERTVTMDSEDGGPGKQGTAAPSFSAPSTSMWDKSFFEDDSLFGDSTSGISSATSKDTKARKSWAVTDYIPLTTTSDFHTLLPNPALTFPFELDDFQKQAVLRLERSECVFLAAHTSAGKTVCAEYAIALAKKHCTRAIYTSPIKALSNQKYRDFRNKFGEDVGLITGDMQIGADGSCLIMTTEILRSMLYRGADLIRDIEWVIFDEVHYINDSERGVVWEEVIILLPDYVNLIFLSATTPNTIEFSEWIGRTKRKPVHVIRTNYRPVPLSHHLWAGHKMHKIMEGKQGFNPKGYTEATKALLSPSAREAAENKKKGIKTASKPVSGRPTSGSKMSSWQQQGSKQDWIALTRYLEREELMPTVTFSFSKKKCEEIADQLRSLDLNTAAERNLVQSFAIQTVNRLSPKDQSLPQVTKTVEMVKRGIGVHHGGLLPILKEMVEILFSRNLIKILFATETFAMGVNMPARSVVFNAIRKHDGVQFRELQPGEYTQMAGRAGRRGLDKVGTVVLCCFGDQPPPQTLLRNMLTGSSTKLQSQFRLTYTMILNLLRVEDMSVEGMIKRSFSEFATQRALTTNEYPKLLTRGTKALLKLDEEFKQDADSRLECEDIEEYYGASQKVLSRDAGDNPFAGMKARVKKGDGPSTKATGQSKEAQLVDDAMSYLVDAETAELNGGLDLLDLRECAKNMHQGDSAVEFGTACDRLNCEVHFVRQFRSHYHPSLERYYSAVERKETLRSRVETLRHLLSNDSLQLFPDFLQRKAMLQSMGYVDENDTVCLKGRVACEVNTCEGLIVTEMVFEGMLNELEPAEIVAALSALLFQEKTDEDQNLDSELPERLVSSCERMKSIAVELGQQQKDFGLPVDPLEYCATSLKMGLVHVVYEWACGVPFISICELTGVQEGSIVRCITRLDELCREVRNCARVVGNPTLYRKMEAASEAIKRDIVFASSLYVS